MAHGQQRQPRVGILLYSTPQGDQQMQSLARALRELGYTDGRNIAMTYGYAEGDPKRLPALAADLARLQPDVLVALGGDVAPFAFEATKTIPIVFAISADPVKLGLVASLGRPGQNATGVTFLQDELAAKRLELLKEAVPAVSRVAFIWNPDHPDNERVTASRAAASLGVELQLIELRALDKVDVALAAAERAGPDGLYVVSSRQTVAAIPRIVAFAERNKLPLVGGWGTWAEAGGLLSYGPNVSDMVAIAGQYIDKVLKGTKPAELPVQQPTRFDLTINLRTANAIGISIPQSFVLRADRVIE